MADTIEDGPSLEGEGRDLAPLARAVEPSCLGPRRELVQLPARVNNTILEPRTLPLGFVTCPMF